MATAEPMLLLDEVTDFLAQSPSAEEIIAFKPSAALEQRALELMRRNKQAILSEDERAEMEAFMRMDHFLTILKAKARLKIEQP